jgi:hypothetical protein
MNYPIRASASMVWLLQALAIVTTLVVYRILGSVIASEISQCSLSYTLSCTLI